MSVESKCERKFWDNGNIRSEEFRNQHGKRHNEHGTASRTWYKDGKIDYEDYWRNGKLHNEHGPAFRSWYKNGKLACEEYWLEGKLFPKAEWEAAVNPAPFDGVVVERPEIQAGG
jgi:antitoxin component YwqK of YwqJK toxin-antitoxin module